MHQPPTRHDPLQLLTIAEVAQLTRRHRRSIERDLDAGNLRFVRLGKSIRVPRVELERYLEAAGFQRDEVA